MDIRTRSQVMLFQRADEKGCELARAVEGGEAASGRLVEFGETVVFQVGDLGRGKAVGFAPSAGVGWVGLERY